MRVYILWRNIIHSFEFYFREITPYGRFNQNSKSIFVKFCEKYKFPYIPDKFLSNNGTFLVDCGRYIVAIIEKFFMKFDFTPMMFQLYWAFFVRFFSSTFRGIFILLYFVSFNLMHTAFVITILTFPTTNYHFTIFHTCIVDVIEFEFYNIEVDQLVIDSWKLCQIAKKKLFLVFTCADELMCYFEKNW